MTDNGNSDFPTFTFDFSDHLKINKRVSVRYAAPSASLTLRKAGLLQFGNEFTGKLVDISAKGALISSSEPLAKNNKVALKIIFADGTLFNLKGTVARDKAPKHYGIKLDSYSKDLDEYLFKLLEKSVGLN